jgi:hypothetical protein
MWNVAADVTTKGTPRGSKVKEHDTATRRHTTHDLQMGINQHTSHDRHIDTVHCYALAQRNQCAVCKASTHKNLEIEIEPTVQRVQ